MGPNSVYRRAQAPNSNSTTLKSSQHSRIGTTAPTRQINKSNVNATNGTGTRPTSRDDERRPPKRQRVDKGSKLPPKTPVRAPREPEACQDEEDDDDEDEDDEEEEEVPQSKGTGKRISLVTSALEAVISRGIQKGIEDEELKSLSTGAPGLMRASKYYVRAIDMFMSITYLVSWVMVKSKRFRKHLPDVDGLDIGTTQLSKPEEDRMLANYKSLIAYCPVIDTFFKFAERLRSYHEYDVILRERYQPAGVRDSILVNAEPLCGLVIESTSAK
ncbi:pre-mrna-splicing factor cwc22 [Moniliophthora roreri]|nr:pre-mrna-splicing factor cwc22 [Moniliophthora roreri]